MKLIIGVVSLLFFSLFTYKQFATCNLEEKNLSQCCPRRNPELFPRYLNLELNPGQYFYQSVPVGMNLTTDVECCSSSNSKCDIVYLKDQRAFDLWSRGSNDTNLYFSEVSKFNVRCQTVLIDWKVPSNFGSRMIFFAIRSPRTVREKFRVIMNFKTSR